MPRTGIYIDKSICFYDQRKPSIAMASETFSAIAIDGKFCSTAKFSKNIRQYDVVGQAGAAATAAPIYPFFAPPPHAVAN